MQPSSAYFDLVRSQEGCVYHPYLDKAGVPTIGIGTTHYPNGLPVALHDSPITLQEANKFLFYDTASAVHAVNEYVKKPLRQKQFDALVDFAYNIGTGGFHGSTALKLINQDPDNPKIRKALAMWNKAHVDGKLVVLDELTKRRKAEADLYFAV